MTKTTIHHAVTGSRSLSEIARELIASGHDPETLVSWTRNGIPIFTRDQALAWWNEAGGKPATRPSRPSDVSPCPEPGKAAPAAPRGAEGGR